MHTVFILCWLYILIDPYKKNQLDALFILYLFCQSPLHILCMLLPIIRRHTLSTYRNWYMVYVRLTACWPDQPGQQTVSLTYNTYYLLYIYSVYLLMMGNNMHKICRGDWQNKQRTNSASSWFLLYVMNTSVVYSDGTIITLGMLWIMNQWKIVNYSSLIYVYMYIYIYIYIRNIYICMKIWFQSLPCVVSMRSGRNVNLISSYLMCVLYSVCGMKWGEY
jgi:hypothetical protein